jgi:glycosyltransferase involved in cell wall biosynthesis
MRAFGSQLTILTTVQPLVSIVVPVFNGLPYLASLTEAILSQTYQNLDIIFTEGGGSDASLDFLDTLNDPRINVVAMPLGTSAAENWTAATKEARGAYIKLICQDDVIYPEAIAQQVADLEASPGAVMAVAQRDIIDGHGNVLYKKRGLTGIRTQSGGVVSGMDLVHTCYIQGTNVIGEPLAVLFRAEALHAAMPWRDTNPLMLDLSTYQNVAPHGEVVIRRESIGAFRVSAQSWSTQLARDQLSQTRSWQRAYAQSIRPSLFERTRATVGAYLQVNQRRAAYAVLRMRGSLS